MKINIKPLSVNQCWKGRRFKTDIYHRYERDLLLLLPKLTIPEGNLSLKITCGFSNKGSDADNFLKPFIDILQKKYGFNDNRLYHLDITKTIVKKHHEYIDFTISAF